MKQASVSEPSPPKLYRILQHTLTTARIGIIHHKYQGHDVYERVLLSRCTGSRGRDSTVGKATRYGLDVPGIESRCGQDIPHLSIPAEAHPASYTMGTGSFPGVKRPGRGVNHPPHLAPRLKNE